MGNLRVTVVTIGHLRATIGHLKATKVHLRVSIGYHRATITLGMLKVKGCLRQTQLSFTSK